MARQLLFTGTGLALFAFWFIVRPTREMTASMREWPHVLWFSATLLLLAIAIPVYGRMVGGQQARRVATIAGAGSVLSSVANVIEDGFRVDAAFGAFVGGTIILDLALLALAIDLARRDSDAGKLLAIVPGGTLAGILFFVGPGGPILLVAWLLAAIAAARPRWAGAVT